MHKKSPQETVTSLHDLSAVDLIAGYRAKQFSPSEVLEDVLTHVAAWEPHLKALYAFDPAGGHDGSVPVHNPGFVLDDKILPIGASMFARIIETRMPAG
ncbi:metal-dependent amidase/aminoacylase/carboxypeptidase family protein [Bradyrhizobium huanghuaihaiense]